MLQRQGPEIHSVRRRLKLRTLGILTEWDKRVARQAPERFVEQSVYVVVPPIMEGISSVEQITPHEQVQERIVEQSVNVVVRPIMEGISSGELITPHEHFQERIAEQSVFVANRVVEFWCTAS